jgi:glycosyltransferase involved in cell wall biosynthesis
MVDSTARSKGSTRLCIVVESHWRAQMGGAEYQARVIAETLAARPDFEVFYLARHCAQGQGGDPYPIVCIGHNRGIRRRAVFFDAPQLWRTLSALEPDVIYQRMRQSYTAVAASYARRFGKRFVFHVASDYDVMPGAFRKHLSLNTPFDFIEAVMGKHGMRRASAIVTQTRRQAELLEENLGLRPAAVIPNLHPPPPAGQSTEKHPTLFQVAWIGDFKLVKRPEHLVRLAEDLRHVSELRFFMAGRRGSDRVYGDLHAKIRSLGNVEYLGELTHDEVNELLARSHCLVNTSEVEGLSNTFIQAWMRGTVVLSLSADVDGALAERGLGYLAGSYQNLRDLIVRLVAERNDLHALTQRAREFALERYSLKNIDALIDVLTG